MKPFQYATALSKERAVELVSDNGRYFAGGIDVLGELKEGLDQPKILVNVKELPGTTAVTVTDEMITLGANVTLAEITGHKELHTRLPGLVEAAAEVGSPQIRQVATVGGNLAQHSRCWYYRHADIHCLKKKGDMCYARRGENRHHSIFSGSPCISPVVSNLGIMLTALDARVQLYRKGETHSMDMVEFYEMAWYNPAVHHSLRPDDLILGVEIPTSTNASSYMQVSEKGGFDWALVSCAAAARVESGKLMNPKVVLGVVAPIPYMQEAVHTLLGGKHLTPTLAAEAASLLLESAEPLDHNGYKVPMSQALIQRTLMRLVA